MAKLGTAWTKIEAGNIVSFNYKTDNKNKNQTILVLNPKWPLTVKGKRVFHLIGLKLAEQRVNTIKEDDALERMLYKLGSIVPIDESKNIYKVAINPSLLFWGGAKEDAYKKIKPLLNKEPIYRTYDWTIASRSAVFLESIPLRESSIRQLRLG